MESAPSAARCSGQQQAQRPATDAKDEPPTSINGGRRSRYGQYAVSVGRAVRHEKISVGWEADYARKLETSPRETEQRQRYSAVFAICVRVVGRIEIVGRTLSWTDVGLECKAG